jgi:hypothetical protein
LISRQRRPKLSVATPEFMNVRSLVILLACLATPSARPAGKPAGEDPSHALFAEHALPHLQIEISPRDLNFLRQYEWDRSEPDLPRTNVLATVREGSITYTNVTLHLKGAAGSFRPVDEKPAFTLSFDKAAEGQRFHGLQKISLNNSVQDASYLSEIISRELFLAAGVPCPRATHATVELNGRPLGLYVLVEGWNKQFLKRHFQNVQGNLWDGGFARDLTAPLQVNSGDHPADRAPLDALVRAATGTELTDRLERLGQVLDLDRFLTFAAMEVMLVHWDGYTLNRNNYRIFHDLSSNKLIFLPHGLDQMFGVWRTRPEHPITPQMRGLVAKAVLQTTEGRRRYLDRMSLLFSNVFHLEAITNRIEQLNAGLRPAFGTNRLEARRQERAATYLVDRIVRREHSVREQLAAANTPLAFGPDGAAPLTDWGSKTDAGNPSFDRMRVPADTLQITAQGRSYGSWRTSVLLGPGQYRFEGRVKSKDLEFKDGVQRGGVTLRVSGERQATMQPSVAQWRIIGYDFTVRGLEDVELVCELRASSGWAWFDAGSLRLLRKPPAPSK